MLLVTWLASPFPAETPAEQLSSRAPIALDFPRGSAIVNKSVNRPRRGKLCPFQPYTV